MKIKCKRTSAYYPVTVGKVYEVIEQNREHLKIVTDKGSTLWVKLNCRDYEFELKAKKLKKEYD